jgi:hypothetical protein
MVKRKASSSLEPPPSYDSDEITVAPTHNTRQKIQKTSNVESNIPSLRRTRQLECVLIPTPTQEESAALQEATTFSAEPPAGLSDHEIELPAYERPLVLDGKRSRKSTYKGLATSDFFPSAHHSDELQSQAAARGPRPARKSTGQNDGLQTRRVQPQAARDPTPARKSNGQHELGPINKLLAHHQPSLHSSRPPDRPPSLRIERPLRTCPHSCRHLKRALQSNSVAKM